MMKLHYSARGMKPNSILLFISHRPCKFLRTEWLLWELLGEERWAPASTRSWGGDLQE